MHLTPDLWQMIVVTVLAPALTQLVKKLWPDTVPPVATMINQSLATILTFIVFYANGATGSIGEWFLWSQAAGGVGTTGFNGLKVLLKKLAG